MTAEEHESERARQAAMIFCECGRKKRSGFHVLCDACYALLPWDIRASLIKTSGGKPARLRAIEWLRNRGHL